MNKFIESSTKVNNATQHDSHFSNLNVFNIKLNKINLNNSIADALFTQQPHHIKEKVDASHANFSGKAKHYPPANKEWFNSVYAYNKNSNKLLPVSDKVIYKLMKSYFNLYSYKLEKKIKSRRLRTRVRRLSTNRVLVSKPELKHTNDKVIITLYVYNRQNKYYINKIKKIASIDKMDNLLSSRIKNKLKKYNGPLPSNLKIDIIRKKSLNLRSKISKHQKMVWKMLNLNNKTMHCLPLMRSIRKSTNNNFKDYDVKYLKDYVYKCLRKEILSFYFRQLLFFNNSKFEERYLLPLTSLTKNIYKKKIEYNLVNLKYLYLNSHIFSETLITKLRNRKNRLLRVLKTSLLIFKLPPMDRTAVYNEIYNKKRILQNSKIKNIIPYALQQQDNLDLDLKNKVQDKDVIALFTQQKQPLHFNYPLYITNNILKFIKNKYVSGIRIEVAGRLTRRNTAARSVFKLRYKGNIKNMHSSYKGLPSVLLRGHAKSNLQYTNLKSKIRIGSFGLKGWVSSS